MVEEGVELDLPANYAEWPDGADRPEQVLCVSTTDPKNYKVFKYRREVDPAEYRPTGMNFGGLFSGTAWERFVARLPAALAGRAEADEPPGATDAAIRAIKKGR